MGDVISIEMGRYRLNVQKVKPQPHHDEHVELLQNSIKSFYLSGFFYSMWLHNTYRSALGMPPIKF